MSTAVFLLPHPGFVLPRPDDEAIVTGGSMGRSADHRALAGAGPGR